MAEVPSWKALTVISSGRGYPCCRFLLLAYNNNDDNNSIIIVVVINNNLPVKDQHTEMIMKCLFEAVSQTHCPFYHERYDDDDDDNVEGLVDGETSLFCAVHPGQDNTAVKNQKTHCG